ncbi:hypothetical protein ACTFIZ_011881 [Dictyostelium cf. discoideum]
MTSNQNTINNNIDNNKMCTIHPNRDIVFFCLDCKLIPCCIECTSSKGEHHGHRTDTLESTSNIISLMNNFKDDIYQKVIERIDSNKTILKQSNDKYNEIQSQFNNNNNSLKKEIKKIHDIISIIELDIKKQLETTFENNTLINTIITSSINNGNQILSTIVNNENENENENITLNTNLLEPEIKYTQTDTNGKITIKVKINVDMNFKNSTSTNNKPDIVVFDYVAKLIRVIDVCVPYDRNIIKRQWEKIDKYSYFINYFKNQYKDENDKSFDVQIVPIITGAFGSIISSNTTHTINNVTHPIRTLKECVYQLPLSITERERLIKKVPRLAITGTSLLLNAWSQHHLISKTNNNN